MKKNKLLAIILVLCLVLGCVLTGCSNNTGTDTTAGGNADIPDNTTATTTEPTTEPPLELGIETAKQNPALYLTTAIEKTLTAKGSNAETPLEQLMAAMANQGSFSVYVNVPEEGEGNVTFAYRDGVAYMVAGVEVDGENVEIELWVEGNELCLKCPMLFGETVYGISLDNLEEDLPDCKIWDMMDVDYEDVQEVLQPVLDYVDWLEDAITGDLDLPEETEDLVNAIILIYEEIQYTATENGDNAVTITSTMTKEQYEALVDTFVDLCVSDYIMGVVGVTEDISEEVAEIFEDLREMAKASTGDMTLSVVISNETGMITSADVSYVAEVDGMPVSVNMSLDMEDVNDITLTATSGVTVNGMTMPGYNVEVNFKNGQTGDKSEQKMTVKSNDVEVFSIAAICDSNTYTVEVKFDGAEISLGCSYTLTQTELELSNWTLTYDGEEMEIPAQIKVTMDVDCSIPTMPAYKNILTMTEEEWEAFEDLLPKEDVDVIVPEPDDDMHGDWDYNEEA